MAKLFELEALEEALLASENKPTEKIPHMSIALTRSNGILPSMPQPRPRHRKPGRARKGPHVRSFLR